MHDVLAHRLTLLSVHAGALEFRPDAPPAEVARAAGVIRDSAHEALQDLRQIIGVLRSPGEGADDRPQPTLATLDALVAESREAGMKVVLDSRVPDASGVPAATGRNAYRIAQEALTNARKHAPGAEVTVTRHRPPRRGTHRRGPQPRAAGARTRRARIRTGPHRPHRTRHPGRRPARPRARARRRLLGRGLATVALMTIRLLIVDDDPLVRAGLALMLGGADDIEIVGEAADGYGVGQLALELRPDVVLMDIRMPRVDGLTATETLRARPDAPEVDRPDHLPRRRTGAAGAARRSRRIRPQGHPARRDRRRRTPRRERRSRPVARPSCGS